MFMFPVHDLQILFHFSFFLSFPFHSVSIILLDIFSAKLRVQKTEMKNDASLEFLRGEFSLKLCHFTYDVTQNLFIISALSTYT